MIPAVPRHFDRLQAAGCEAALYRLPTKKATGLNRSSVQRLRVPAVEESPFPIGRRRTEPPSLSHLPAHFLSLIELLEGRRATLEWNLHPPVCGDRYQPVAAHPSASLFEHLAWVCSKLPEELLDVGVTHA